jgi:alpha-L-arabinofuranosidase
VNRRPNAAHDGTGNDKSRPEFGTDEALAFASQVGAELLITVNAGTGTAREAAEWVSYVNKGGLKVRYWEIGNELYINDGSPLSKQITVNPTTYARRVREFAQAMRAADSRIKIGAIGGENQGPYTLVHYPDWNKTVLEQAGDQIDFFSVHNSYAPVNVSDRQDLRTVYKAMFAAPVLMSRNLNTVAKQISDYAPKRAIQVAVTEWGPFFQTDPAGAYAQHTKTLGSAVFAASALKALIESPATAIASIHVLNDLGFMGWINSSTDTFPPQPRWTATARYYAFTLFSQHFGSQLVRSDATSPTFDSEAIGFLTAVRGVPYLDVVSSLSADGKQLFIIGINKHFDNAIPASIRLRDFAPAATATAWTLNGTGIDAHTGTKPVRIPGLAWGKQMEDSRNPRFSKGAANEITLVSTRVNGVREDFSYTFPAHSVTSIVLTRR